MIRRRVYIVGVRIDDPGCEVDADEFFHAIGKCLNSFKTPMCPMSMILLPNDDMYLAAECDRRVASRADRDAHKDGSAATVTSKVLFGRILLSCV